MTMADTLRPINLSSDKWILDADGTIIGIQIEQGSNPQTYLRTEGGAITGTVITSTVATGTAPLIVASTTNVANLNASTLSGATMAAPGAIGGGTAAAITGTVITANTGFVGGATPTTSSAKVGAVATGVTAVEYGDGMHHVTQLTIAFALPAIAGGAALAVGKLLYTLPPGVQMLHCVTASIAITQTQGFINADTPEVGLGTVIASGAVATLDTTATFENILTGQVAANCTGTATVKTATMTATPFTLVREVGDAKTVFLNVADGWAASGDAAAAVVATVTLVWNTLV